ncbi:MAG: HlyD family secretion protein [Phycisphaerales bacterium]|nr:HlyD family secretion protein [Phycisphaerales bacterium]
MSAVFARSIRSLRAERFYGSYLGLTLAIVLIAAWLGWFTFAQVPVYLTSSRARLEVNQAAWKVSSPLAGQIANAAIQIGMPVQAGEVLLEFVIDDQQLELHELQATLQSSQQQIELAQREILQHEQALKELEAIGPTALDEARARQREAESKSSFAQEHLRRIQQLAQAGDATDLEQLRARANAEQMRAALDAARLAVERMQLEHRSAATERRLKIEQIQRDIAKLEGQRRVDEASIRRLEHEIARRRVVAPVSGVVGEAADIRNGSVLAERDWIATIIPSSAELRVVAEFPAASAMGRIAPNQKARVRLQGFPWSQYGSIVAVVDRVAGEMRAADDPADGPVLRAELKLQPLLNGTAIPLQHGLLGTVEVEVERLSPAMLVLRAAGARSTESKKTSLRALSNLHLQSKCAVQATVHSPW